MRNGAIIGLVIAIFAIGVAGYWLTANQNKQENNNLQSTPSYSPTPLPITPTSEAPEGWLRHVSIDRGFAIMHPPEAEIEEISADTTRIQNLGDTQSDGTEITDGFSLSFSSSAYSGDFQQFVESEHERAENDPVTESVSEIEDITLAGNEGFRFTTQSLGENTIYYFPSREGEFLRIVRIVQDPENRGYNQEVDQMLNTLTIIRGEGAS